MLSSPCHNVQIHCKLNPMNTSQGESPYHVERKPRVAVHRPLSNTMTQLENKTLFSGDGIAQFTDEFNLSRHDEVDVDSVVKQHNPGLLAFRNRTKKAKMTKPVVPQRTAQSQTLQINNPRSFLNSKPTYPSAYKVPPPIILAREAVEQERRSIGFTEDPLAYFAKHKDGNGHLVITLNYASSPDDPDFSPYELVKVPSSEADAVHFTMSATGVTKIESGKESDTYPLDVWVKESMCYGVMRNFKFFSLFRFWKVFRLWIKFVVRQRYQRIASNLVVHPYFVQKRFYETMRVIVARICETQVKELLLAVHPQKKYSLKLYAEECQKNKDELKAQYNAMFAFVLEEMSKLDAEIRDPARTTVKETDFMSRTKGKPKLGELMIIEEKVKQEQEHRKDVVHKEVVGYAHFIRTIDYIILETLSTESLESWRRADKIISGDMSAIFEVKMSFSAEGQIEFSPTLDELLIAVSKSLSDAMSLLRKLPRLLNERELRPHLKEVFPVLRNLYDDGPYFDDIVKTNPEYEEIKMHIVNVIASSYKEAMESAKSFTEFFPLYELGTKWSCEKYIHKRCGESRPFLLSTLESDTEKGQAPVLYDPSEELIVDFDAVTKDVEQLRENETKLGAFGIATVKGALYIDTKDIRHILAPIPSKCQKDILESLRTLFTEKVDGISHVMRFASKKLKNDPGTLDLYVDFCEFLQKIEVMTPLLEQEVAFVDDLIKLLDSFNTNSVGSTDRLQNPLHDVIKMLRNDQKTAHFVMKMNNDKFVGYLRDDVRSREDRLKQYIDEITSYPASLKEANIPQLKANIQRIRRELIESEPEMESLTKCQAILKVTIEPTVSHEEVEEKAYFAERMFQCAENLLDIEKRASGVPFDGVDIPKFCYDVNATNADMSELRKESKEDSAFLSELESRIQSFVPVVEPLTLLNEAKMSFRHWAMLFEKCNRPQAYYAQIKIDELMALGILKDINAIKLITSTAHGESQLENDVQSIHDRWVEVKLPLIEVDVMLTEDNFLLDDVRDLVRDILDSQAKLDEMMKYPFSEGCRETITSLITTLGNCYEVLGAWRVFQDNWIIMNSFYSRDETAAILPQEKNKFMVVKRRLAALIKHSLEDLSLFHVCSYPSLLEMLNESNATLVYLLEATGKFIDKKRELVPRLSFLSNDEIITLYCTTDVSVFLNTLAKLFMNVSGFGFKQTEELRNSTSTIQDFSQLRILSIKGLYGDELVLLKPVQCNGNLEDWISDLIDAMKKALSDCVRNSIASFKSMAISEWVMTVSSYVAALVLQVWFTRDISECFSNLENNPRSFLEYLDVLESRIRSLTAIDGGEQREKLAALVMLCQMHVGIATRLSVRQPNFSQNINWRRFLHMDMDEGRLIVEHDGVSVEHGYEFYGSCIPFVYSSASEAIMANLCSAVDLARCSLCFGPPGSGKMQTLIWMASMYGRFIYFVPAYHNSKHLLLLRVFSGAVTSGAWLAFHDVHKHSRSDLYFIYESARSVAGELRQQNPEVVLDAKTFYLDQNCRVFFTGSFTVVSDGHFPVHVKMAWKPVAFTSPLLTNLSELALKAYGFSSTDLLSKELAGAVEMIPHVLSHGQFCNGSDLVMKTVKIASAYLEDAKSIDGCFLDYSGALTECEQYCLVYTLYRRLLPEADNSEYLLKLLRSHFPLFENYDTFAKRLCEDCPFDKEQKMRELEAALGQIVEEQANETLARYLVEKALHLYELMELYPCVVISGPSNSGKSTIIRLLEQALHKVCLEHEDRWSSEDRYSFLELYHSVDQWKIVFGDFERGGNNWRYGSFAAVMTKLENSREQHHQAVILNGAFAPDVVDFVVQLTSGSEFGKPRFNNMSSLRSQNLHLVIETDSLQDMSSECACHCGILRMDSIQIQKSATTPNVSIAEPLLILDRAISYVGEDVASKFQEALVDMYPAVADAVLGYCWEHVDVINYFAQWDGFLVLVDSLLYWALVYTLISIKNAKCDAESSDVCKTFLLHSCFTVFSQIFPSCYVSRFESWMREKFVIVFPANWISYSGIDKRFEETFPKPSLLSMISTSDGLKPLDSSPLDSPPIVASAQGTNHACRSDVSVFSAQYLPLFSMGRTLFKANANLILYGTRQSGKTSFLKFLTRDLDNICPIVIPVYEDSDGHCLTEFLQTHTSLLTETAIDAQKRATYALIFDNVPAGNLCVFEYIRMLVKSRSITVTSRSDPKYLEVVSLMNFFVIVVTDSPKNLPIRMLGEFFPMRFDAPDVQSVSHICSGLCSGGFVCEEIANIVQRFILNLSQSDKDWHVDPLRLLASLEFYQAQNPFTGNELPAYLKLVLIELKLQLCHNHLSSDDWAIVRDAYSRAVENDEFLKLYDDFFDGEEVSYLGNQNCLMQTSPMRLVQEELQHNLGALNESTSEHLHVEFFKPIVWRWSLLQWSLSLPGANVVLRGPEGSGRYSLTRLVSYMKGCEFIHIRQFARTEKPTVKDRKLQMKKALESAIRRCIEGPAEFVVFMRAPRAASPELVMLSRLYEHGDVTEFLSDSEYERLCDAISQGNTELSDLREARDYIATRVKASIHFVFAVDNSFDLNLLPSFRVVDFKSPDHNYYAECATEKLSASGIYDMGDLVPDHLVDIMVRVHDVIASQCPKAGTNYFYDFIETFVEYLLKWDEEVRERQNNGQNSALFVSRLANEINLVNNEINELRPQLEEGAAEYEQMLQSFVVKRDTVRSRLARIDDEVQRRKEELEAIGKTIEPLRSHLSEISIHLDLAETHIPTPISRDIPDFDVLMSQVPPVIKFLMDLMCYFAEQSTGQGQNLLREPGVFNRIRGREIGEQALVKCDSLLKRHPFVLADAKEEGIIWGYLFEWTELMMERLRIEKDIREREQSYQQKADDLARFSRENAMERESIQHASEALEREYVVFEVTIAQRRSLQKSLLDKEERLKTLTNLNEGLDEIASNWMLDDHHIRVQREEVFGEALMFAAFLTYSGLLPSDGREELRLKIVQLLEDSHVRGRYHGQYFANKKLVILDESNAEFYASRSSVTSYETEMGVRFIQNSLRTPLVIDPDGMVRAMLLDSIGPNELVRRSLFSNDLKSCIVEAIEKGKTLVVEDVDWFSDILEELLVINHVESEQNVSVRFCDKKIVKHPQFRLVLFSSRRGASELPISLVARVTLLDMSGTSLKSVKDHIVKCLLKHFHPESEVEIDSADKMMVRHSLLLYKRETELMGLMNRIVNRQRDDRAYDFVRDKATMASLLTSKGYYLGVLQRTATARQNIRELTEPFRSTIAICLSLWELFSRQLPGIRDDHVFLLSDFLDRVNKIVEASNPPADGFTSDYVSALNGSVITGLLGYLTPQIAFNETMFSLLFLSCKSKDAERGSKTDDWEKIVDHINAEYDGRCDFRKVDVCTSGLIEQLKYANVVNIFSSVSELIADVYSRQYTSYLPCFEFSRLREQSNCPILIKMSGCDASGVLDHFGHIEGRRHLISISLCDDPSILSAMKTQVRKALEDGEWVVIHYTSGSPFVAAQLNDIVTMTKDPSTDFRLFILCETLEWLPQTLIRRCARFEFESFPSVHSLMMDTYQHHSDVFLNYANSQKLSKVMFMVSMIFSCLQFRRVVHPIGFSSDFLINELSVREVIDRMKRIVDDESQIPVDNLNYELVSYLCGCVLNELDRRKIEAHVNYVTKNEQFVEPESSESELWPNPPPMSMSNYSYQIIAKMPVFPSSDVLLMDAQTSLPLLQWNMSRWVSLPFLRLHRQKVLQHHEIVSKLQTFLRSIPPLLKPNTACTSPMTLYCLAEVNSFNRILSNLRACVESLLSGDIPDGVLESFSVDKVPNEWENVLEGIDAREIPRVVSSLRERHNFYSRWMENGRLPKSIDVSFLRDLKMLLVSYLHEIALQRELPVESLVCRLSLSPQDESGVIFTNLWMVGANWSSTDGAIVETNSKTQPLSRVAQLFCSIAPVSSSPQPPAGDVYACPLLMSLEGDPVAYVPIRSAVSVDRLFLSGAALVCRVPDCMT